jgi:putative hemolysin
VDALQELLGIEALPNGRSNYETLGGMIITHLGHIPATGTAFVWEGCRFEIVDMDGARVDKVLISREPIATAKQEVK